MGNETKYAVKETTLNAVLQYLAGRPYHEVFALIKHLQEPEIHKIEHEENNDASNS